MGPQSFAESLLGRLGIKPTPENVRALVAWQRAEGGHWNNQARFNPLNTTQAEPGAGNTGSQGNIKVYKSWDQGLDATVHTLRNGRYGGILGALEQGRSANAVGQAIGDSPWGTSAGLIQRVIAGTAAPAHVSAGASRSPGNRAETATTTIPGQDNSAARRSLIAGFVQQGGAQNPAAVQQLAMGLPGAQDTPDRTVRTPAAPRPASPTATSRGTLPAGHSPLFELFYNGPGGINVKNGQHEPIGFVSGHRDHVHVAAGPKTVVQIGKLGQSMGLHVGENPHFGGVHPVHVQGSYHYRPGGEAIDVSGTPAQMRRFNHAVAKLYGLA